MILYSNRRPRRINVGTEMIASSWDGGVFRILHAMDYVVDNPLVIFVVIAAIVAAFLIAASRR